MKEPSDNNDGEINGDNCGSSSSLETKNIFRDSYFRYMGYANEVGESFRYQFPKLVRPSYILAFGYCAADAVSAGLKVQENFAKHSPSNEAGKTNDGGVWINKKQSAILYSTFDTLLWQCLASVMIPGAAINTIVKASRFVVSRNKMLLPKSVSKWLPTGFGLGSIPFIIHPIDSAVDYILDKSTRRWFGDEGLK